MFSFWGWIRFTEILRELRKTKWEWCWLTFPSLSVSQHWFSDSIQREHADKTAVVTAGKNRNYRRQFHLTVCGMDRSDRSVSTSAEIRTGTEFLHQPERSKFILFCKSNKIQQLTEQVVARSVAVAYNNFRKLLCWQELPSALNSFLLPETAASKLTSVNYVEGNISSITHTHLTTALYSKLFCFTLCFYLKS